MSEDCALTQEDFILQLRLYNCCAANKIAQYIDGFKSGKDCEKLYDDAKFMFNLIDSIVCMIPSTEGNSLTDNELMTILSKLKELCGDTFRKAFQITRTFSDGTLHYWSDRSLAGFK